MKKRPKYLTVENARIAQENAFKLPVLGKNILHTIKIIKEEKIPRHKLRIYFNNQFFTNMLSAIPELKDDKRLFFEIVENLYKRTKLLDDFKTFHIVQHIVKKRDSLVRKVEDFKAISKSSKKQRDELIKFCFDKYGDAPKFLHKYFECRSFPEVQLHLMLYISIGSGKNLRKIDKNMLPSEFRQFEITRKFAHTFLNAPEGYSLQEAIVWTMSKNYGLTNSTIDNILSTRMASGALHRPDIYFTPLWESVIRFFGENPMLAPNLFGPVVDYINSRPATFSMSGRTPQSLISAVEKWHGDLQQARKIGPNANAKWEGLLGVNPYMKEKKGEGIFTITQITTGKDLIEEGQLMRHCVGSYISSCIEGRYSIWKFELDTPTEIRKLNTISVSNYKVVGEIRGPRNRLPTSSELFHIKEWAQKNGLQVSSRISTL